MGLNEWVLRDPALLLGKEDNTREKAGKWGSVWLSLKCWGLWIGGGDITEGFLREVVLSNEPGEEEEHRLVRLAVGRDSGLGGRMDWMSDFSSRI